jgi:serine/threonine protein kinase
MLQVGTTFANRYRVERRIAAGGMGSVYEVTDLNTERRCALKVMLPELANAPRLRERFALEARIPGRAESDHIVQVMDAGLDATTNHLFLVMELLRGEDLAQKLERQKRLAPAEALVCLRQLASALEKTHALGIIHRDLKPQNLFVGMREDGTLHLKVLDFGISKVLQETSVGSNRTDVMGSPQYMAPEQFAGHAPTPATDIFALAMIAYTLLVGDSYWAPEAERFHSPIAFGIHATKGVQESAVGRALQLGKQLPASFDEWFFKATHLEPEQRYRSASEAVKALATVLSDANAFGDLVSTQPPATLPLSQPPVVATDTMKPMESSNHRAGTLPPFVKTRKMALSIAALAGLGAIVVAFALSSGTTPPPNADQSAAAAQTTAPEITAPEITAPEITAPEPTRAAATPPTVLEPTEPAAPAQDAKPSSTAASAVTTASAAITTSAVAAAAEDAPRSLAAATPVAPASPPRLVAPPPPKPAASVKPAAPASVKPAAPQSLCYYALSSGRVVRYVPGQTKAGQKTFPCRQNASGQYAKVP